jgi:transcriptional regulator with XRE-family HTH domain
MSVKEWEKKVLEKPGAKERVAAIEDELRLAAGLTALREQAGLSQRELARRMKVSQPRVVAIEQSHNVTIDVLEQYVAAVGGTLEVTVVKGNRKIPLLGLPEQRASSQASCRHRNDDDRNRPTSSAEEEADGEAGLIDSHPCTSGAWAAPKQAPER